MRASLRTFIRSHEIRDLRAGTVCQALTFFTVPTLINNAFRIMCSIPNLYINVVVDVLLLCVVCRRRLVSASPLAKLGGHGHFRACVLSLFSGISRTRSMCLLVVSTSNFGRVGSHCKRIRNSRTLRIVSTTLGRIYSTSNNFVTHCNNSRFIILRGTITRRSVVRLYTAVGSRLTHTRIPCLLQVSVNCTQINSNISA